MYARCLIIWASKMQTLVTLSTTEAEYIALLSALHEVIAIMNLLDRVHGCGVVIQQIMPKIVCRCLKTTGDCNETQNDRKN